MSAEIERHKPDLRIAPNNWRSINIRECFSALLSALADSHSRDGELHQLWLEANWLKSDFEQLVFARPKKGELLIFKILRGEVSSNLRRNPEVIRRVVDLASALEEHLSSSGDRAQCG